MTTEKTIDDHIERIEFDTDPLAIRISTDGEADASFEEIAGHVFAQLLDGGQLPGTRRRDPRSLQERLYRNGTRP